MRKPEESNREEGVAGEVSAEAQNRVVERGGEPVAGEGAQGRAGGAVAPGSEVGARGGVEGAFELESAEAAEEEERAEAEALDANAAFLVGVQRPEESREEAEGLLGELRELVGNVGLRIAGERLVRLRESNARYLVGSGKMEELVAAAREARAGIVVFDEELTPAQQRNWEKDSGLTVIDRQEVILDIFAQRARTKEATLQVELATLEYSLPRLKRAWTHLNRQRGGGVTQRGEGETQLQLDQRMVRERIARVKEELAEVVKRRAVQRKQRMKVPLPTAAIVGYTNAGKSSLLNRLTNAGVLAVDKLFATLDPTTRRFELPGGQPILVTDTVGFVRRLPHRLVEAFKATLEEAIVSDFLIHVVDGSSPDAERHLQTTLAVLQELGADTKRVITVLNKMDLQPDPLHVAAVKSHYAGAIPLSTRTGQGVGELLGRMEAMLEDFAQPMELLIPHDRYDLVSKLHEAGAVRREEARDDGFYVRGNIPTRFVEQMRPFALGRRS